MCSLLSWHVFVGLQCLYCNNITSVFRTIRLQNGLTALLISDPRKAPNDDEVEDEESDDVETSSSEGSSAPESDSGRSGSGSSDKHGVRRGDYDEEKLVSFKLSHNITSMIK